MQINSISITVHVFWEGHKISRNLHQLFDWQYIGQITGGDLEKFCGLLRIYELYQNYAKFFSLFHPFYEYVKSQTVVFGQAHNLNKY